MIVGHVEDAPMSVNTLARVAVEMKRAKDKHGENYMGNLTVDRPRHDEMLEDMVALGREAKFELEEMSDICRMNVLIEEVGELAEDLLADRDITAELTQVAAMSLAWLEAS